LRAAGLAPATPLPKRWVADCRHVGTGEPALKYLSRYLYRGVIGVEQLVADDGDSVTFAYRDGKSGKRMTRTVSGPRFVWEIVQHVMPTGLRRVHDYGFLHGNARQKLLRVLWFLKVQIVVRVARPRPPFPCSQCRSPMRTAGFIPPQRLSG